jgi:hypothetical protein
VSAAKLTAVKRVHENLGGSQGGVQHLEGDVLAGSDEAVRRTQRRQAAQPIGSYF